MNVETVAGARRAGCHRMDGGGAAERLGDDLELMCSDGFRELCRERPQDFTRDRKLPPGLLTECILAKRGRSMRLDIRQLTKEGLLREKVSAPALCKARQKLNPLAVRELVRFHAAQVYEDGGYLVWHGLVSVGVDGSSADADTNAETLAAWGNASNEGARPRAQAGLSTAFDLLNRQILDVSVGPCALDERGEVAGHAGVVRDAVGDEEVCLFLDRGYPSIDLFAELVDSGTHFIARCPKGFLKSEFEECAEAGGDLVVDVALTRARLHKLRESGREDRLEELVARGTLRLRLVIVDVGGAEPVRLATDLPGPDSDGPEIAPIPGVDLLSKEDLKDGYHLRWGSETCYRFEKEPLELENVSGRKLRVIEQDIYATAYLYNLAFDLANEADEAFEESGRQEGYKHRMAVSGTYCIGALSDDLVGAIIAEGPGERARAMGGIVDELLDNLEPVRPGRSYGRGGVTRRKGKGKGRTRRFDNTHKKAR